MEIIVLHQQNLLDIALQYAGTIEGIFELAGANALQVTDDVSAGKVLIFPEKITKNNDILTYYTAKSVQPATAFSKEDKQVLERQEGISIWSISLDFLISE